jgi:hypothetical protein
MGRNGSGHENFSTGFSMKAVKGHVSYTIEEAEVYVEILREHAKKGGTFFLDQATCNSVMDIIGNVAL